MHTYASLDHQVTEAVRHICSMMGKETDWFTKFKNGDFGFKKA